MIASTEGLVLPLSVLVRPSRAAVLSPSVGVLESLGLVSIFLDAVLTTLVPVLKSLGMVLKMKVIVLSIRGLVLFPLGLVLLPLG